MNLFDDLRIADRFLKIYQMLTQLSRSLKYLLLSFLFLLILDIIFHFSSQGRIVSLGLYVALLAGFVLYLFWYGFIKSAPLERTARLIEVKNPEMGSALINSLDLHKQLEGKDHSPQTAALIEQALSTYQEKFCVKQFKQSLNPLNLKKETLKAFLILGLICLPLFFVRDVVQLELKRFFDPYGEHPPFSLTQLSIVSPSAAEKIVYGQDLMVKAESFGQRLDELYVTYYPVGQQDKAVTLAMYKKGDTNFVQKVENIRQELMLQVHSQDRRSLSQERLVKLIYTPNLEKAEVTIRPPAYTGLKEKSREYKWSNLTVLKGSEVEYKLTSNRPLQSGVIKSHSQDLQPDLDLKKLGENEVVGALKAKENLRLQFTVTDVDGRESVELYKGSLTVSQDQAPTIYLTKPEKNSFIAENFPLEVGVQCNDDYGVAKMRLHFAVNGKYQEPQEFEPETAYTNSYSQLIPKDLKAMKVKAGDTLSFYADVTDNSPAKQTAVSSVLTLKVVSVEDYNDYLRKRVKLDDLAAKYSKLQDRMTDLGEEQKELNEKMAALQKKMAKELKENGELSPETKEALNSLIREQNELNSKLDKLAKELKDFTREQPLFDFEKEFGEKLKELAKDLEEGKKENQKALEEFSKSLDEQSKDSKDAKSGEQSQGAKSLAALNHLMKKSEEQAKRLGQQEKQMQEQIQQPLEDMAKMQKLVSLLNRYRALYDMQKTIAEQAKAFDVVPKLSQDDERVLKRLAAQEKFVRDHLKQLPDLLREAANEANETFPTSALSARDLADLIEIKGLKEMAGDASNAMLIPDGSDSYRLAEKLRLAMFELFSECEGLGNACQNMEFDKYLQLMLSMNPGQSFSQMDMFNAFGYGPQAYGPEGYSQQFAPGLLGNEPLHQEENKPSSSEAGFGNAEDEETTVVKTIEDGNKKEEIIEGKNSGESLQGQGLLLKYNKFIDAYFEKVSEGDAK